MNYFYDTEFKEDGKTIDLISIGILAEDGREYYAVSAEFDTRRVAKDDWLMDNVMSSIDHEQFITYDLDGAPAIRDIFVTDPAVKSREQIKYEVWEFLTEKEPGGQRPDLWAWFSAYDHVCLAQLWGPMINMPQNLPYNTDDIKTLMKLGKITHKDMPQQPSGKHNALSDAKFNKVRYDFCMEQLYGTKPS